MPSASRISLLLVAIGVIAPTTDLVLAHLTHARSPIWNLLGLLACDRSVVGISVGTAAFVALRQFLTVDRLGMPTATSLEATMARAETSQVKMTGGGASASRAFAVW